MNIRSDARHGTAGVAATLALVALLSAASTARADDPMAPYRERFKQGMDRYKAGNMGEAIQYWEPIYREVGPETGYRLSFDLARAYDQVGESTRAAERYESFLSQLGARRTAGEALEPIVLREEEEAKKRRDDLQATKGRIRVTPGRRPLLAQVDLAEPRLGTYVSYVAPGAHVVTFAPGSAEAEKHSVDVKAGEMVEVAPNPEPTPETPEPHPPARTEPPPPALKATQRVHPFSPIVVYVTGGAAAVSTIIPIVTYGNAWSIVNHYRSTGDPQSLSDYSSAKPTAYATLAIPLGLAAITAGLAIGYLAGTKDVEVSAVSAGIGPVRGGATGVVGGRF
jgi:hypothetical protein